MNTKKIIFFLATSFSFSSIALADAPPPDQQYQPIEFLTRHGHQMGLYIVRAAYNIQNAPTVSAMPFLDTMAPDNANKMALLNKWQEIDWEFVPFTPNQRKPTASLCHGLGTSTACEYFSGLSDYHTLYTNSEIAKLAKAQGIIHADQDATWDNFVAVTGKNNRLQLPDIAVIDAGQPGFIPAEQRQDPAGHFLTTNAFVMPHGDLTATANIDGTTYTTPVIAAGPSGSLDGKWPIGLVGAQMSATDFMYNPDYNAHDWHYYTIALTPEGLAWYIDAPDSGYDIDDAKPVRFLPASDYPYNADNYFNDSFAKATQQAFGVTQPVGSFQMIFQIWADKDWGGQPVPGMISDSYVSEVAFAEYDAKNSQHAGHTTFKLPEIINFNNPLVNENNWTHLFTKNFDIDVFNYGLGLSTYQNVQALKVNLHTAKDSAQYEQALSATTGVYTITGPGIPDQGLLIHVVPLAGTAIPYDLHIYPHDRSRSMLFPYGTTLQMLGGVVMCAEPDAKSHGHGTWHELKAPKKPYIFVQGYKPDGNNDVDGQITINILPAKPRG